MLPALSCRPFQHARAGLRFSYQEGLRIELLANILFYLIQLITAFELSIDNIADTNLAKLLSRKERNVLHGSGDNR
jgi:hypothetical protein